MTTTTQALTLAREALILADVSHGVMLKSDPPQEAWKHRKVSHFIGEALAAIDAHLASDDDTRPMDPAEVDLSRLERIVADCAWPAAVGALEAVAWRYVPSAVWGEYVFTDRASMVALAHSAGVAVDPLCSLPAAQAQIAALTAKVAELERDRERVDWIGAKMFEPYENGVLGRGMDWYMLPTVRGDIVNWMWGRTFREAIDHVRVPVKVSCKACGARHDSGGAR